MVTGSHLIEKLSTSPWYVRPEFLKSIEQVLNLKYIDNVSMDKLKLALNSDYTFDPEHEQDAGPRGLGYLMNDTWVIDCFGAMLNRVSGLDALCGMVGYNMISQAIDEGITKSGHILFNWDSPGGMSSGAEGLAKKIRKLSKSHVTTSLVNNSMYSAAYFAGSAADRIYATSRSDGVGSIGTYLMHVDQSMSDALKGLKVTYISAGEYKTIGNSHEPLSSKALDYLQKEVNAMNDVFLQTVLENRSSHFSSIDDVKKVAEGQTFLAHEAVTNGLIDGIATLEEIVGGY